MQRMVIFFDKLDKVLDKIAPIKEICIKNNIEYRFDQEIYQGIQAQDNLFNKFKRSPLHSDKIKFKNARNRIWDLIQKKKQNFISKILNENIAIPKELWKLLNLQNSAINDSRSKICLNTNGTVSFDAKESAETFNIF